MGKRNIIVIGASAGGFEALKQLVAQLPADFNASIFIVWHMSPNVKGILPHVLNKHGKLPATHAQDKEPIKTGHIYVAQPDHHLLLSKGMMRVTRGPKENRFRPAVDPLFRSASLAYGTRVIGVILSGALDDGSAGMWTIKHNGGLAIVQHPDDAEIPSMPENAIKAVTVDHIVPVSQMASLLVSLINEEVPDMLDHHAENKITETEVNIAMENNPLLHNVLGHGDLTPYTCPECHGVLTARSEGDRIRFRCHTGHAYSADSLLADLTESIEDSLWTAIRSVQESVILLNNMGDHFAEVNQPKLAAMYFKKAKEAEARANIVRAAVVNHEQLSSDTIKDQAEGEDDTTVNPQPANGL